MARYSLEIKRSAVRELEHLPTKKDRQFAVNRISNLAHDPRPPGSEKLVGEGRCRIRQGAYRVIYEIDDTVQVVRIVKVAHRREVCRR